MAEVLLNGVCKTFGEQEVIKGIDLHMRDSELTVLVGPSGCGKSTLLRLIAGLEDVSAGEIRIGGEVVNDVPPAKRGIAMVFQSYALYPHMKVYDNMAFGLKLAKYSRREIQERVRNAARILQIDHLLERKPRELSGGQRQRVAIGRAIVREPRVFLFDEPLSNLDAALRVQMRVELARLQSELGATMIYVTHDQTEAMTLGHQIVVLNAGQVEQAGTPLELYHQPRNRFVAQFIGTPSMNFLDTHVTARYDNGFALSLPGGESIRVPLDAGALTVGEKATLGIRPEHLHEYGGGTALPGTVEIVEQLGSDTYLHVRMEQGQSIIARFPGADAHKSGDRVRLGIDATQCHVFNAQGMALGKRSLPARTPGLAKPGADVGM